MKRAETQWLRLETRIRDALDDVRGDVKTMLDHAPEGSIEHRLVRALILIDDAIGEKTGRGYPIDVDPEWFSR